MRPSFGPSGRRIVISEKDYAVVMCIAPADFGTTGHFCVNYYLSQLCVCSGILGFST